MSNSRQRGRPRHDDILTPAEWRTVHAVRHGLTNRQIAERRGISEDAVKYHVANAIAKLELDNRKALRCWIGAPKESPMNQPADITEASIPVRGLGQVSRSVRDIKESEAWYRDVLHLDHLYTFDKLAFFDCGGTRLMLNQGEAVNDSESMLYLRVEDIRATHQDLEQRGVEFINPPHMIHQHEDGTEEWMAFFKDPEGRPLAIMSTAATGS
ncbi:MAG: LuxR C-terminal-related transcriptional regulator [Xanthomonadales bacterium]|nr:LuxR C-terminal-related transcriptional regulator [Xanthomonadales bacterium]